MPPEGINPVAFPESMADVWRWFMTLNRKRPQGFSGVQAISEAEIGWFFINRGITLEGWELEALDRLDAVALESFTKTD